MQKRTISEVKELISHEQLDDDTLSLLRMDKRKGIKQLIDIYDKKQEQKRLLDDNFKKKQAFDFRYKKIPGTLLAGVDEAGRGPLAGPVVAAAVILPDEFELPGLTDSKQLNEKTRNKFYKIIIDQAITYHISIIDQTMIDRINIYEATKLAMKEALAELDPKPQIGLIDAVQLHGVPFTLHAITKGDDKSMTIAAASVLAKVKRDEVMARLHQEFPVYNFFNNKGYGTKDHLQALQTYGPCKYHRTSFSPVSTMIYR